MTSTEPGSATVAFAIIETAIGPIGLAWGARGITRLGLPERDRATLEARMRRLTEAPLVEEMPDCVAAVAARLSDYATGKQTDFRVVEVDLGDLPPTIAGIYAIAREIGWGETATYGDIARRAGSAGLARVVGQAMGRNPVPIIVPCHRVLAAGRKIGGFSGAGGAATKERLLALEGLSPGAPAPLLDLMMGRPARG